MSKKPNRFVVQVRNGVVLFFNRTTEVEDGWWWGSDADPLQQGPFASSHEAVANARRDDKRFKLVCWDRAALARDDRELRPTGHVVLIDTSGRLWAKTGEHPAREGWKDQTPATVSGAMRGLLMAVEHQAGPGTEPARDLSASNGEHGASSPIDITRPGSAARRRLVSGALRALLHARQAATMLPATVLPPA